jgi:hypothetical protein
MATIRTDTQEFHELVAYCEERIAALHKMNETWLMMNEERIANCGRIAELRHLIGLGEKVPDSAKLVGKVDY